MALVTFLGLTVLVQIANAFQSPIARSYTEGESISYEMVGVNQDDQGTRRYSLDLKGVVQKDSSGIFFETFSFLNFLADGSPVSSISTDGLGHEFSQKVSLDIEFDLPAHYPDQSKFDPRFRAPSDDLFNMYVDLQLVAKLPMLQKAGDRYYLNYGKPAFWDHGHGQTCIDFEIEMEKLNSETGIMTVKVAHVPPKTACVDLPAKWMQVSVVPGLEPNNVVNFQPRPDSRFNIIVGRERIDVELNVDLNTGKILSGHLIDSFDLEERICSDAKGQSCGEAKRYKQVRTISIQAKL